MIDWEMVNDALEQAGNPYRDPMVVKLSDDEYIATYRWEINDQNGWLTVQLMDGSILPTQPGRWCPRHLAADYFGIQVEDIKMDGVG